MALRDLSAEGLVVAALTVGLLAVGCAPGPGPSPPASPTPSASASPSASPSPPETAEERQQREAFEAAELAYRRGFAEVGKLTMDGGASKPTATMSATMMGSFLSYQMNLLRYLKEDDLRASSVGKIAWIRLEAYGQDSLRLETCEDYREVQLIKPTGATQPPDADTGTRVYRQIITMQLSQQVWKASKFETAEKLQDCG